jgi:hypothetical protein
MERKGAAAAALLVIAGLIVGFLLAGATVRPQPTTTTLYTTATETITVQIPVKHQIGASSAVGATTCIYAYTSPEEDMGCERNVKTVTVRMTLRQLGVEDGYINLRKILEVSPGLKFDSALGEPQYVDGRIVIRANNSAQLIAVFQVSDLRSFVNWMNDIGVISIGFVVEDYRGNEVGAVVVGDIPVEEVGWSFRGGNVG